MNIEKNKISKGYFLKNWKDILKDLGIRDVKYLPNDYYLIRKNVFNGAGAYNFLKNKRTTIKSIYESWKLIFGWKERREDIIEEEFYERLKLGKEVIDDSLLDFLTKQIKELKYYFECIFKLFVDYIKKLGLLEKVVMFPIKDKVNGLIIFYEKENRRNFELMIINKSGYADYYCYWDEVEDFLRFIVRILEKNIEFKVLLQNILKEINF